MVRFWVPIANRGSGLFLRSDRLYLMSWMTVLQGEISVRTIQVGGGGISHVVHVHEKGGERATALVAQQPGLAVAMSGGDVDFNFLCLHR